MKSLRTFEHVCSLVVSAPNPVNTRPHMYQEGMAPRTKRVKIAPPLFVPEAPPSKHSVKSMPAEEQGMYEQIKLMRNMLQLNNETIKDKAHLYTCPLLCAEQGVEWPRETSSRDALLATQMTVVAVADDGFKYDFAALKRYIERNLATRLVSPITKKPMNSRVYFIGKGGQRVKEWVPSLRV